MNTLLLRDLKMKVIIRQSVTDITNAVVTVSKCGTILFQAAGVLFKPFPKHSSAHIDVAQCVEHFTSSCGHVS